MLSTILVVEDHDAVRRSLCDWLEVRFPTCRVIGAASGEDALHMAKSEPRLLVVMDITLPGMSGIEAVRRIKALRPCAKVVMLTVHEDDSHRADATAAGACAYVSKRAMQTQLLPTLTALLAAG